MKFIKAATLAITCIMLVNACGTNGDKTNNMDVPSDTINAAPANPDTTSYPTGAADNTGNGINGTSTNTTVATDRTGTPPNH